MMMMTMTALSNSPFAKYQASSFFKYRSIFKCLTEFCFYYAVEESQEPAPTVLEMELPWKRDDEDGDFNPIPQSEFPLWVENPDYTNYYSPTTTYLGIGDAFKYEF